MKNIHLICNGGMSTSLIVNRMKEEAAKQGKEYYIEAFSLAHREDAMNNADVVMVGPQIRHAVKQLEGINSDIPIEVINMRSYGMMDSKAILQQAEDAMNR